jgi:hypothetical protein
MKILFFVKYFLLFQCCLIKLIEKIKIGNTALYNVNWTVILNFKIIY